MSFPSRPVQPRPDHALIRQRRVRSLYAPTSQNLCANLIGAGLLEGVSGATALVRFGPGGLALENDGASDLTHFATRYDAATAFHSPPVAEAHTMFGVVSHRSFGTHRNVLSINNSDSRFEMRVECDSTNGFAYSYWDNYVIGQRFSIGSPPALNVPIAFVATLTGNATGSTIAIYTSDGMSTVSTLASTIYPSNLGHCDAFVRGDGHAYMWGHADGVWSREAIQAFLNNPFALIARDVDAPIVSSLPDVFEDWLRLTYTDPFEQASYAALFPGDGTGWWGSLDEPPSGSGGTSSITTTGTEVVCDAPFVSGFNAKASIQKGGYDIDRPYRFFQGDTIDVLVTMRIDSASAEDCTLLDIEAPPELYATSPGIRVYVNGGLVAFDRAKIGLSNVDGTIAVPIGVEFRLRLQMFLSMRTDGQTKIWIDGVLGFDFTGINMPEIATFAGVGATINLPIYYDMVEMGATANETNSPTLTVALISTEFRERTRPRGGRGFRGFGYGVW